MRFLFVVPLFLVVAACGEVADVDVVGGQCFERRAAQWSQNGTELNGVALNAQWTQNGTGLNAQWAQNGVELNGLNLNGVALNAQWSNNGTELNGVALNAQWSMNGTELNAQWATNGTELNGLNLNGLQLNSLANNGTRLASATLGELAHEVRLDGSRLIARVGDRDVDVRAGDVLSFSGADGDAPLNALVVEAKLDASDAKLATYRLQIDGEDVCADGDAGMFVRGRWTDTAAHVDDTSVTYSCPHGAIMKCVLWGYAPWSVGADMHETCTRMVRADYCGDGVSWTRNGTLIDVYDTQSIETPVANPKLSFEAAWGTNGAVCVNQPRYLVDGERPACWDALPKCESLDEGEKLGATIANDSAHTPITLCP